MLIVWADEDHGTSHQYVEIHIIDFDNQFPDCDAIIFFQKQVLEGIKISNPAKLKSQLRIGKDAIEELIY